MTTASTQDVPRDPGLWVLVRTLLLATAVGVAVVVTALIFDRSGVAGAVAGAGITLLVMLFGLVSVHAVSAAMPSASLLVAMLTYLLQVGLLTLALSAMRTSGAWGSELVPGWVVAGVVTVTIGWAVAQVWHYSRARIPVYDLPRPLGAQAREAGAR